MWQPLHGSRATTNSHSSGAMAPHPPSMRPRSSARFGLWSFDSACAVRFMEITALQVDRGSRKGLDRRDEIAA